MTKNGNTNVYYGLFDGPNGEPMVQMRAADLAALLIEATRTKIPSDNPVLGNLSISAEPGEFKLFLGDLMRDLHAEFDTVEGNIADTAAIRESLAELASGKEELVPGDMVKRIVAGETPLKVWREYRGLKQTELADKTGIDQGAISKIENGKRMGDVDTLKALADGLGILVDDLVL